ncbi:hypothetical protein [Okeania sp. KiyG1]|uniref:hypothetical protein n=1 Tax=Okeania sp. KiyG1 TaxID=2720165 RepID=UPI0019216617|nr:hypothetical protein [Okeania sp. KiyG1]GGA31750.1 hypothetical protein CYANOKiyG1_48500 [Okeania sp. KiyG1]
MIQAISKKQLKQGIINPSKTKIYLKTLVPNSQIKQVRIIPRLNHYVIEVIYEATEKQYGLEKNRCASIDIGLNNLAKFSCRREPKPLISTGIKPKSDQWQTLKIYQ